MFRLISGLSGGPHQSSHLPPLRSRLVLTSLYNLPTDLTNDLSSSSFSNSAAQSLMLQTRDATILQEGEDGREQTQEEPPVLAERYVQSRPSNSRIVLSQPEVYGSCTALVPYPDAAGEGGFSDVEKVDAPLFHVRESMHGACSLSRLSQRSRSLVKVISVYRVCVSRPVVKDFNFAAISARQPLVYFRPHYLAWTSETSSHHRPRLLPGPPMSSRFRRSNELHYTPSDLASRGDSIRHEGTPINPADDTQIDDIEAHLKRPLGEDRVTRGQEDDEIPWSLFADRDDVQDLTTYEGIKSAHQSEKPKRRHEDNESLPRKQRRDQPQTFTAFVTDPKSRDDSKDLTDFIQSKVPQGSRFVKHTNMAKNVMAYGGLAITQDVADEIGKHDGIRFVRRGGHIKKMRSIPKQYSRHAERKMPTKSQDPSRNSSQVVQKRTVDWRKQSDLSKSKHLVVASQFSGSDIIQMNDYIFDSRAGEGIYIYVIEEGVQINARNKMDNVDEGFLEFRHWEFLATEEVMNDDKANNLNDDDEDGSHGTNIASAALGLQFGIAKSATLVSVKWWGDLADAVQAIQVAADDITDKKREAVSVVLFANGDEDPTNPNEVLDSNSENFLSEALAAQNALDTLLNAGVPFVVAAGNDRKDPGRDNVDFWPAHFSSDNYPIIVAGEVNMQGQQSQISQGGPLVTTWAMTDDINLLHKDSTVSLQGGTSMSAAVVAGLIATWMASDQPSWDKNLVELNRVKAIRKFLQEGPISGWKRGSDGERVAWNGAMKHDHDGATPSGELVQAHNERLYCNDLNDQKFGRKVTFQQNIADFCREVVRSSNSHENLITNVFNDGELQKSDLSYSLSIDENQANQPETEAHCRNKFERIIYECDLDPKNENGYRYSAGGQVHLTQEGTSMEIKVENPRLPWIPQPRGACNLHGNNNPSNINWKVTIQIGGRGWEGNGLESLIRGNFGNLVQDGSVSFTYHPNPEFEWEFQITINKQFRQVDKSAVESFVRQEVDFNGAGWDCNLVGLTLGT
ncbi:hypothetical protein K491DRAFT_682224 [Lophiostoma macrostomum CBS 122681]|uniref:Peptidase S8/S53 domain-containing protein n=1 Tax=Lophiostoma macrostomum CBS 122681 TaxID=1314788 RepID=A0A6A6SXM3_9PLEO|nr:hypothetical protein K491DRAFT_682224 [Lophiostoma macrostomum CBS 122681]